VEPNGPAAKAGLKEGDVITELNGRPVTDSNALRNHIAGQRPNTEVSLTVLRDGKPTSVKAHLVEREATIARAERGGDGGENGPLGMTVAPLTPSVASELELPRNETGLVVTGVEPGGVAAEAGLQPGDVLKKVNGRDVTSVPELKSALSARRDAPALVQVHREGTTLFVALPNGQGRG
jgi:serine protease Do